MGNKFDNSNNQALVAVRAAALWEPIMHLSGLKRLITLGSLLVIAACSTLAPADEELILVVGATGGTGQQITAQLLEKGYAVRALVRDADRAAELLGPDVELFVGDVREPATLTPAFAGASRVISAIGSSAKEGPASPEFIDYGGNNNLADAALNAGVNQFVLVSSMGVTHDDHPLNKMLGNILIWKMKNENYIRASGLNYTIVRPGGLHDKPGGENRIVFEQSDTVKAVAISRADVAEVCVAAIEHAEAINKTFEIFTVKEPAVRNWQEKFAALN